jgi:hypothetical protein
VHAFVILSSSHGNPPTLLRFDFQVSIADDLVFFRFSTNSLLCNATFCTIPRFVCICPTAGSEAIDLAAAPVLSEVALAVASNDPVPTSGGAPSGNSGINNINSLDSALFAAAASSTQSQAQSPYFSGGNAVLMSDRQSSDEGGKSSTATQSFGPGNGRPLSGESEFSPPPSLSLSPSATGSPISSGPVSPVQLLSGHQPHQHQHNSSGGSQAGISHMSNSTSSGQGLTSGQYDGGEGDSALLTGHGFDGATAGSNSGLASGMNSPLGSALGGISLSGSKDSKRRLSMIR